MPLRLRAREIVPSRKPRILRETSSAGVLGWALPENRRRAPTRL